MCCRMANREHRRAETAASAAGGPVGLCHLCESSQDSSNCKFSSVPIFYGNPSSRQYSAWVLLLLQRRRGSDMLPGATRHGAVSPRADADLAEIRQVRGGPVRPYGTNDAGPLLGAHAWQCAGSYRVTAPLHNKPRDVRPQTCIVIRYRVAVARRRSEFLQALLA